MSLFSRAIKKNKKIRSHIIYIMVITYRKRVYTDFYNTAYDYVFSDRFRIISIFDCLSFIFFFFCFVLRPIENRRLRDNRSSLISFSPREDSYGIHPISRRGGKKCLHRRNKYNTLLNILAPGQYYLYFIIFITHFSQ